MERYNSIIKDDAIDNNLHDCMPDWYQGFIDSRHRIDIITTYSIVNVSITIIKIRNIWLDLILNLKKTILYLTSLIVTVNENSSSKLSLS